jgi:hypothetical protein
MLIFMLLNKNKPKNWTLINCIKQVDKKRESEVLKVSLLILSIIKILIEITKSFGVWITNPIQKVSGTDMLISSVVKRKEIRAKKNKLTQITIQKK